MARANTLLLRFASGDDLAGEEFLGSYSGPIERLARGMIRDPADRDDAVQDVYVKLLRRGARYREERGAESTFVDVVARRTLLDARRRLARSPLPESLPEDLAAGDPAIRLLSEDREEVDRVRRALDTSSGEGTRVLKLALFAGLSHRDIAERLRRPLATVRTQARRALLRLRSQLLAS